MAYTKTTWAHDTKFTTTNLDNCETQYDEGYTGFSAHNHDARYYSKTTMESTFWYAGNDGTGSGWDADLIYDSGGNKHYTDYASGGIVAGIIVMYAGAVAPSGWQIANGTNGTRDLRDRWVVCAGLSYAVGATAGSVTRVNNDTLNVATTAISEAQMPSHRHVFLDKHAPYTGWGGRSPTDWAQSGNNQTSTSGNTANAGSGTAHGHTSSYVTTTGTENRPASLALYYIQKL